MALSRRSAAALTTFGVFTLIALAFASSNYASYTIKNEPVTAWIVTLSPDAAACMSNAAAVI